MARQVTIKTIEGPTAGRDAGKVFQITEMSARQAHTWATRAIFAMLNGGVEVPANIAAMGVAGLAVVGLSGLTKVNYETAAPLLEELLSCARAVPDPSKPDVTTHVSDANVEEFTTYFSLQNAAYDLIAAPFTSAARSTSASAATASQ